MGGLFMKKIVLIALSILGVQSSLIAQETETITTTTGSSDKEVKTLEASFDMDRILVVLKDAPELKGMIDKKST